MNVTGTAVGQLRRRDPWLLAVLGLALFRVLVPLAALAASGHELPGFPFYRYEPLSGDATGFYAAARELISATTQVSKPVVLLLALVLAGSVAAGIVLWRRLPGSRWAAVAVPLFVLSLVVAAAIREMSPPGAAVIGWSLVWAVPMAPFRVLGLLDPDVAFGLGLALSLVCVAATTLAVAAIGCRATGRRCVGVTAAALWALWPFIPVLVVGESAWENSQWQIDTGLHLYTEPLSTALVAVALAILLRREPTTTSTGAAGFLLGFATLVKLSNALIAAVLLPLVVIRHGPRHALPYVACGLVSLPAVVAYWPKGYVGLFDGQIAVVDRPFSLEFMWRSWRDSLIFSPRMLLVLLPLAVLGAVAISGWYARWLLILPIVVTAVLYSAYYVTAQHPRFLYVALPPLLALEAAGAVRIVDLLRGRSREPAPSSGGL